MEWLAPFLADRVNYLLILLLLLSPFVGSAPGRPVRFWLTSALSICLAVALAEAGKRLPIWPGHPSFPSGHETFALAAGTCLIWRDRRWAWAVLPLAAALGWALVAAHYHQPVDVAGALLLGPPVALLCQVAGSSVRARRRPGTTIP